MKHRLTSYMDFAEDDLQYFQDSVAAGFVHNSMCAMAPYICERYLKDVINKYYHPQNITEQHSLEAHLRMSDLHKLIDFIRRDMQIEISDSISQAILKTDRYCNTTQYPSKDSIIVTQNDIDQCQKAIMMCRSFILDVEQSLSEQITDGVSMNNDDDFYNDEMDI